MGNRAQATAAAPLFQAARIVEAQGGVLDNVQVQAPGGEWVAVHDPVDPVGESRALVDRHLNGQAVPPIAILIGVGLGYVVEELERRRPDVRVVAIELGANLLACCRPRYRWYSDDKRARLIVADVTGALQVPSWPPAAVEQKPVVIVTPVLARLFPDAYQQAKTMLRQFLYEQRANAEARRRLAGPYLSNTVDNLPALAGGSDVAALDSVADGKALVLIGAGPSLNGQMSSLLKHRDRAWFVALDTALRPLMQAGIVPDLVVSIDPTAINARHLFNLPSRRRPWLVAEASLDPTGIRPFAGRTFFCRIGRADPWPWLETFDVAPTRLQAWGSVLTASCDLIVRMKAARVIFAGLDLSYTNNQPYCRGTAFEEDWRQQQQRDRLPSLAAVWEKRIAEVAIDDVDREGRRVRTAPQMVAFRNWVRTLVTSNPQIRFINATGRGILHGEAIEHRSLGDALAGMHGRVAAEQMLQKAAVAPFASAVPRLIERLESLAASRSDEARQVWSGWQESIPDFNATSVRARLIHATRCLSVDRGRSRAVRPSAEWQQIPFRASNFHAKAPMGWRVSEQNVVNYAYWLRGRTMTLTFKIARSVLAGSVANELYLALPDGFRSARSVSGAVWMSTGSHKEMGSVSSAPGASSLIVRRGAGTDLPLASHFWLFGQLTIEV